MKSRGLLIVLSGPSGVGKGTICSALRQTAPELVYSISATTRSPREGEREGVNYFYKQRSEFEQMIKDNQLLEWAEYVGNLYGTPKEFVEQTLAEGKDIVLEIEVQGAMQVKKNFAEGIFIFIMPPSFRELESRIVGRGTEDQQTIRNRIEMAAEEIKLMKHYHYAVVNDEVELACKKIQAIITAEHCKRERVYPNLQKWTIEV